MSITSKWTLLSSAQGFLFLSFTEEKDMSCYVTYSLVKVDS